MAIRSITAIALAAVVALSVACSGHSPRPDAERPIGSLAANLVSRDHVGNAVEKVAGNRSVAPNDSSAESTVAGSEVDFAINLLRTVPRDPKKNVLVSPSSLSAALAMLNYGARGRTQDQIAALLGPAGASAQDIARGWSSLVADWAKAAAANKITLDSADSVWLQRGAPLTASFSNALADYFDSGVWQVDFDRDPDGAARDLNAWVSRQTRGKITNMLSGDDVKDLLLVLVNAVYFRADWAQPLDKFTRPSPFTTATGEGTMVDTMRTAAGQPAHAFSDDAADVAELPYRGGRFAAVLIEPKVSDLAEYEKHLSGRGIDELVDRARKSQSEISMPTLRVAATTDFKPVLQRLGMTDAFVSGAADLMGLSPAADYVAFVKQKATLDVTPKGTIATAATAIGGAFVSARVTPESVDFDHPFLFLIRDTHTGAILFSAEINDPRAH